MINQDYLSIFAMMVWAFMAGYFVGSIEDEHPGEDITTVQYYQQSLDYLEDIRENTSK